MKKSVHKNINGYLLSSATGILYAIPVLDVWAKLTMTLAQQHNGSKFFSRPSFSFKSQPMKQFYSVGLFIIICINAHSQFSNGGVKSNFGIDADTRAGYTKYGVNSNTGDDWFAGTGQGVIDTFNASYYKAQLKNDKNISFAQKMSLPAFSLSGGNLWLDGGYLRDYFARKSEDITSFGKAAKNGDNPNDWQGTAPDLPGEDDIIDAYFHLRRNGSSITDSLWLFVGMSTVATDGDRYVDMELYKNNLSFNPSTGKFSSAGLSLGHTEWLFDPLGNIIQTGDVIITATYPKGHIAPEIDVRIWVNRVTALRFQPALFDFGKFDGSVYGYVSIVPRKANTSFGAAIANISDANSKDTTLAAPWGTASKSGSWSANYESLQFLEIGLNLNSIGIDPVLYKLGNPCSALFNCILFKARASHSFTANLHDFAGPIYFNPVTSSSLTSLLNFSVNTDTLTCTKPIATLAVSSSSKYGAYSWSTLNGNIVSSSSDGSSIQVKKSGLYTVTAQLATGCPVAGIATVFVPTDSLPPVATADIGLTPSGDIQLLGGDPVASNFLTPFGKSKGLQWEWKGPNGFSSGEQNPLINMDWAWGAYYLTLKELRNGCTAGAAMDVSFRTIHQGKDELSRLADNASAGAYLSRIANRLYLVTNQKVNANGRIAIYSANGALLSVKNIQLSKGQNNIELPAMNKNEMKIVSLYVGEQPVFIRKVF
jgi:hypothetical protein